MRPRPLVAEFIGTFTLIYIGAGSIAANELTKGQVGLVGIALAHGLAIAVMVSAAAAISGGHFNPAVTIAALAARKISPFGALAYAVAQCLGAIAGAAVLRISVPAGVLDRVDMGTPAPGSGVSSLEAFIVEVVLTFFLMFVIYGTAIDQRAHRVGGLFIGLTITLDILMGGPISGAAMNPARWLGPALLGGGGFQNVWIYWLAPPLGAVAAALLYKYLFEEETAQVPATAA
jgi:aquaporin TIP